MNRIAIVALGAFAGVALGQTCDQGWSSGFANAPSLNAEARGIAMFDSGRGPELYIGGHFSKYGNAAVNGIARWDGTQWAPVGAGISPVDANFGGAYWIGTLDDGSGPALYVGGQFEAAGGAPAACAATWDGAAWSALGAGFDDTVRMMTLFDAGAGPAIHATGLFRYSGAALVNGIARWNGAAWQPVGAGLGNVGIGYGWGYSMHAADLGGGPRLYVGGKFTSAGGVPAANIASWDGSTWSPMGEGFYGNDVLIIGMGVFDHGGGPQLHVGGRFALTSGVQQAARVARWDGTHWVQLGADLSPNILHYVNSFNIFPGPGGKPALHVGGWFNGASWLNQVNYAARWENGDWRTLDGGMSNYIRATLVHNEPGGGQSIYAAGSFETAGDAIASRAARWDGERWHGLPVHRGLTGPAHAACAFDDGSGSSVFIGGEFAAAGGRVVRSIAAWDGGGWRSVGAPGQTPGVGGPGTVRALHAHDDGSGPALYVAGTFNSAGGGPALNIARWNGQNWSAPGGNGVTGGAALALASHDDGSGSALYVGGTFVTAGGVTAPRIARWNGIAWSGVGAGFSGSIGSINALAEFDDGSGMALYAGGFVDPSSPFANDFVYRWDGAAWAAVAGPGPSISTDSVRALAVHDDGSGPALYAAGRFAIPIGTLARTVARWNGMAWQPVGPSTSPPVHEGPLYALHSWSRGWRRTLVAAGHAAGQGPPTSSISQWDGTAWSGFGSGLASVSGPWYGAALATGGSGSAAWLLAGGRFDGAGRAPSSNVAGWRECPCYGDCNGDAALTAGDFACFQGRFMAGDPRADCNADGALAVADFACFQTRFASGCP